MYLELGINEFYDNSDSLGLFDSEPDPETFLSIEREERSAKKQAVGKLTFNLSDRRWKHERQYYSLMTLAGDLGGFIGTVFWIPQIFMSFFSSYMYKWAIS